MLSAQEELNVRLFPDWWERNLDWDTAILIEAAELIDHTPWKWWKTSSETDWGQVRMEAVDIWHFILSKLLQPPYTHHRSTSLWVAHRVLRTSTRDVTQDVGLLPNRVKDLTKTLLSGGTTDLLVEAFVATLNIIGLSFDDLFRLYVGKAELNRIRWANGYGTTYSKDWLGEEDNQYLTKLLESLTSTGQALVDDVRAGLQQRYKEVSIL